MPRIACLLAIALSSLGVPPSAEAASLWFEAEQFARSNWPGGASGAGWFAPEDQTEAAKLSGGTWLNTGGADKVLFAEYELDVPATGTYKLYARRFWRHGPFRWRFDGRDWTEAPRELPLLDSTPLRKNVVANWIGLGPVKLTAGRRRFRVELLDPDGAAAFDCFLLTDEPFTPRGVLKPGETTGLHAEGTWAFEPGIDPFDADCPLDLSGLNENVAGQSGRVRYRDGRFLLGDGRPVRFWGVNIGAHEMDLDALRYQAKRLAKLGVNHVRFHESIQPRENGSRITDVNERLIDNCHRMVAAMRDEGIYTTISPFFVLTLRMQPSWKVPHYPDGAHRPFGLLFWDERLQTGYKAWVRELLTRPNPYTGVPLAKDPAVHVFQLQNEDSLLFWTFLNGINAGAQADLGRLQARWLVGKYGSTAKTLAAWGGRECLLQQRGDLIGDDLARGIVGFVDIWLMTSKYSGPLNRRVSDQIEFLAHLQRRFNSEMAAYIRQELGYEGLIAANVWRAADPLTLLDVERWTYTAADVIDQHHYATGVHVNPTESGRARYTVDPGDLYISRSFLTRPRELPTNYKMVAGLPHIVTECTWPQPNRFKAEAPPLVAAYGALTDLDGFVWFSSGSIDYDRAMTKFQVNLPSIMGQFPAAALIYRQGYVAEAPVVVSERRPLEDLWRRKFPIIAEDAGYDPNRDFRRPGLAPATKADPLSYLVGRVEVAYGGRGNEHAIVQDMSRFIDRPGRTVRSATGEVTLDYGDGLLTIDAPRAQGAAGFLADAGTVELGAAVIRGRNEYGSILVVSLDGKPLGESRRVLIQAATEEHLYEFETSEATLTDEQDGRKQPRPCKRIDNPGRPPWNVVNIDATVTLANPHLTAATAIDPHGYRQGPVETDVDSGAITVTLPADSLYTIVD